ncbi:MAG TPA: glycosyltransferase family 9 protein [Puia sp.]|nr:glycosyltransferase family 9 protein [Puia sp.]
MDVRRKQKIDWYAGYLLIGLLLPFARALGAVLRRDHSTGRPPRRIVFIKLLGLGSLIVASDAIAALRARFPQARLILLTDSNLAAGIEPFGAFDEIRAIDTGNLLATFAGVVRFLFRAWGWRRLWVIDLEVYSKLTTVLALLTLARNRIGFYLSYVPFRRFLNTHNVVFDQAAFLGDNYLKMAKQVTGRNETALPPVRRDRELDKPYILVNNTCSGLADVRKLPDRTCAAIAEWVLEHTTYGVAFLGTAADRNDINRLINYPELRGRQERILNYAGMAEDFSAYYAFLRENAVCLVTIDSGPLHIARRLGLATVSVWGPTDPDNYLKVDRGDRKRHLIHYLKSPCSPCVHHYDTLPCGGNNFCMNNIQADAVIEKLGILLQHLAEPLPEAPQPAKPQPA